MSDSSPLVPIGSLLDSSLLTKAASIANAQVEEAIELILRGLLAKGVSLHRPDWITSQGFYQFLTKDLLDHQLPEPAVKSSGNVELKYDDIRFDSPNFMAGVTEDFLLDLLSPAAFIGDELAHTCRDGAEVVSKQQAILNIQRWKDQWIEIVPIGFRPERPVKTPDGSLYFQFQCAYETTDRSNRKSKHDGGGLCQLALEGKSYRVVGCMMVGFEM